ncbi:MAG: hypothetical protein QOK36_1300 [Gaiellales bacterium]|jgi:hypothetical protein|nr:hypothetical protein [Gaiellales bacterium]
MSFIRRKNKRPGQAAEQQDAAMRERALRLVDTRGVVVREAEAELHAAIAELRSYATPQREQRVEEATRALEEAKRQLRSASAEIRVATVPAPAEPGRASSPAGVVR